MYKLILEFSYAAAAWLIVCKYTFCAIPRSIYHLLTELFFVGQAVTSHNQNVMHTMLYIDIDLVFHMSKIWY